MGNNTDPNYSANFFRVSASDFLKIPGSPIAYWVNENVRNIFLNVNPLRSIAVAKLGMRTGDNNKWLRHLKCLLRNSTI